MPARSLKKQEFRYSAPTATSVQLVGDFTHWSQSPVNLAKEPDGTWRASVPLPPGSYHYRFLVDGEWCDDPDCTLRVSNPFGTQNAVRQVT